MSKLVPIYDPEHEDRLVTYAKVDTFKHHRVMPIAWLFDLELETAVYVPAGESSSITLAEEVLGGRCSSGETVRYRNGNRLDCRLSNLELRSRTVRDRSSRDYSRGHLSVCDGARLKRSRFKGVLYDTESSAWVAFGFSPREGRYVRVGSFSSEIEAARAARSFSETYMSIHTEYDWRSGTGGRHLGLPTERSEKVRLTGTPIGGKDEPTQGR